MLHGAHANDEEGKSTQEKVSQLKKEIIEALRNRSGVEERPFRLTNKGIDTHNDIYALFSGDKNFVNLN